MQHFSIKVLPIDTNIGILMIENVGGTITLKGKGNVNYCLL